MRPATRFSRRPASARIVTAIGITAFATAAPVTGPAAAVAQPASAVRAPSDALVVSDEALLASELGRLVQQLTSTRVLTPEGLAAAEAITDLMTDLAPADADAWRLRLTAARLAEDDDAMSASVSRLGELDPSDDVVTLARLQEAVDARGRTVEDRLAFLEFLVAAGRRGDLTGPLASRIAYELALLRQRAGDLDGFAAALLESMEFDPAHPAAARTALEFFLSNARNAVDEAELLINLLMADPPNRVSLEVLARVLLEQGAYEGAARLYAIAADVSGGGSARRAEVAEGLVADQALSLWGQGDVDAAIRAIEAQERFKSDQLEHLRAQRARAEERQPGSTAANDPLPERASVGIGLSSIRLSILTIEGPAATLDVPAARGTAQRIEDRNAFDPGRAGASDDDGRPPSPAEAHAALLTVLRGELDGLYREAILESDRGDATGLLGAEPRLAHAWAALTLLDDAVTARTRLDEARAIEPLDPAIEARFTGWLALREGDAAAAIQTLGPIADADPLAALGLAFAHEANGDAAASRVLLRGVAVADRGGVAGVSARRHLRVAHGEVLPPTAVAARLEGMVSALPATLDRIAWNDTGSLRLQADFRRRSLTPFEPMLLDLHLTNNAPVPLALDPRGPIVPRVILVPSVIGATGSLPSTELVVDLHRRLRLEPRERLTVTVDLRRTPLGTVLHAAGLTGATVRVEAYVNHEVRSMVGRQASFYPLPISSSAQSGFVRLDGIELLEADGRGGARVSADAAALVRRVAGAADPRELSIADLGLANHLALSGLLQDHPVLGELRLAAASAIRTQFPRLDPVRQAWLVATAPVGVSFDAIRETVAASDHVPLRVAWLLNMTGSVDDPLLLEAFESDDGRLRRIAAAVDRGLRQVDMSR